MITTTCLIFWMPAAAGGGFLAAPATSAEPRAATARSTNVR
jgi:hypothetical protein